MSIFEDARKDTLDKRRLDDHRLKDSAVLTRLDPATGYTPLATAVAGHAYLARDLIEWGADPAGLSGDGETPLLLAAWKAEKEQALLIHYLLRYAPKTVDMTCQAAGNKTPLMFAVEKEDLRSIRELRKHGASVGIKDDDGFSALQRAEAQAGGKGRKSLVMLALDPIQEKAVRNKVAMFALNSVLLVVSIADKLIKGALRAISRWNPSKLFKRKKVKVPAALEGEPKTKDEFVGKVDTFIKDGGVLERFFKDKIDFVQTIAKKTVDLSNDTSTSLGEPEVLPKTVKVNLHQQVIYCDDSSSMNRQGRWESQRELIKRIARIATTVLPDDEGVELCFINQNVGSASNLSVEDLQRITEPLRPRGDTPIGTSLKSKILQPLVYQKLEAGLFERPLLITIITDGMPEPEPRDTLVNAIVECGQRLEEKGFPRNCVKFVIGQVGTADAATRFLDSLRANDAIRPVTFVMSDRLDAKYAEFNENTRELDRWLIETLFSPIQNAETEVKNG